VAVLAGRECTIYVGGTPTTMTGEACVSVAGEVYHVEAEAKRVLDPASAIVVYDGVTDESATAVIDYAAGRITLAEAAAGDVTVDAKYIPLHAVTYAKSADITLPAAQLADSTLLGDSAARAHKVASKCEISLAHFYLGSDDLDSTGGTLLLSTLLAGSPIYLKVAISDAQFLYGWFVPASAGWNHAIDDVLKGTLGLKGIVRTCTGRPTTEQALFSLVAN
jgi:hypothetical protein